jgi:phage terminase large subunit
MELTSPTHKTDDNGRTKLEAKEDLRKRGLPSPDLADSLAVTFYMDVEPSNTKDEANGQAADKWDFWESR